MPKIVDKDLKRSQILEAALRVFAKKGLAKTTMIEIANEAGVGKGTLYEYFKNKDEIIGTGFDYFMDRINTVIAKHTYRVHDPLEKLRSFFHAWIVFLKESDTDFMEVILDYWAEGLRDDERGALVRLNQMYIEYRAMIQYLLDDCVASNKIRSVNTLITASIIIGALDGILLQWVLDKNVFSIEEAIQTLSEEMIQGLIV